jgi:membrane-associated phospholipid phosphatase
VTKRRKIKLAVRAADLAPPLSARPLVSMAGCAVLAATVRSRTKLGLSEALATACAFAIPPTLAAGFRRSPRRDGLVWATQMWAYKTAFEMPNDDEQRLRDRVHIDYAIAIDSRLGGGMPPGQRLQRSLRQEQDLSWRDKMLSLLYWTWEVEPHFVMAWFRWKRPHRFAAAAGRLATTFDLTLLGYWAVPSAPPWWSSEKLGRMDGDVRRVMVQVARALKREPNPTEGDGELDANPFAAMPSDHFASAAMAAMLLAEEQSLLGVLGWCYALGLGFALVYLGEHYVVDELAGLALALVVNRSTKPLERLAAGLLNLGPS